MDKRGQVTMFVIIAILVVVAGSIIFIVKDTVKSGFDGAEIYPEIKTFVDDCIEKVGKEAILEISSNGGYLESPLNSTSSGVPFYLTYGESQLPKKERIEEEISKYVSTKLFFCTRNFADFPELEIKQGSIFAKAKIEEGFVQFDVEYPITIRGENGARFEEFEGIRVSTRLNAVYEAISEFVISRQEDPDVCMNCLLDISLENDVYINMIDGEGDEVLFFVRDKNIKINEKELVFVFANKYKRADE